MIDKIKRAEKKMVRRVLMIGGVAVVSIICAVMYLVSGRYIATDNSYIKSAKIMVTPEVSGIVESVSVTDNQPVKKGDVLFIDEIHRLNKVVEETLYPAMEDYALDIILGKGPSARTLRLDLPQFTIVGATTRVGMLSAPLRDRFGVIHRLNFYEPEELKHILSSAAEKLQVTIDPESLHEISLRARGTPRIGLKLLKRVRDYAQVHGSGKLEKDSTHQALSLLEIDSLGLDSLDVNFLKAIIEKHAGGPVGIETIASTLSEDVGTLEDMVEPYLLQLGFIKRSPRGRIATKAAYKHLGITSPVDDPQQRLL